uniref:Uncharacterized protein n=1 Tax=Anguilla anguilla TaxID=7936 RepID=A0A0E9UDR4_ANGAN
MNSSSTMRPDSAWSLRQGIKLHWTAC